MHAVRLQAGDARFPDCCAACYGPAEVSYGLTAERGVDFVAFRFVHWVDLALPLCRRCRRRRRLAGMLALIGLLAALVTVILVPILLTGDTLSTELALFLVAVVYGLVILYRWRARPLADGKVLACGRGCSRARARPSSCASGGQSISRAGPS